MQKPVKKIRKINNLPNLSSTEQTHFHLKQYPHGQQANDQSTLNVSNDHHYEQAINEIKPNKTPYGFQQVQTQLANSNLKQSIGTENRGNGSNNSQRYAAQQFHQPMYTSSKQSPSQIQTQLQNNNNSVAFRKATSNGSNKPQQQNQVSQNNISNNNFKNNQTNEQIVIIGGYSTITGKQSTVPSRQNSGGPIKQIQQQQSASNDAVKLIAGQIAPPGSTQPRKVKQISTVNSQNVSPKNIHDLLKFRAGQGHDQNQNQPNIQRQQINTISNQANNKIAMVNQSQIINQQPNAAIFFQDGLRNRKQNINTGNSDNYQQQNYQQINQTIHQQNEGGYIRSSSDGKQPTQINSKTAQGLKDNSQGKLNTSGVYSSGVGGHNQQSPVMPGNGNSQVNYQPRKQLKKTVSNEGSAFMNSIGPQSNRPLQQNFITRPISSGQNDNSKGQNNYGGYVKLSNQSSQVQNNNPKFYSNIEANRSNNSGSSATLGSYFQNNQGQNIHHQQQHPVSAQPNIVNNQLFLGNQGTPISNDQLQEVIQKLIKNSKKHFHKNNQETEELTKYLRSMLVQHLEKANGGNLPNQIRQDLLLGQNMFQPGSDQKFADNSAILNIQAVTGNDPQGLNDLINELLKLNKPLVSQPSQRAGSMGPVTNQKNKLGQKNPNGERSASEKANIIQDSVNNQSNQNGPQYQNIQQQQSHQNNMIHQQQRILQQHPGHSGHSSSSIYNDSGVTNANKHGTNNPVQHYGAQNPNNISLNTSTSNISIGNNGVGIAGIPNGVTNTPGQLNNQSQNKPQQSGNIAQQNVQVSSSQGQKKQMKMQRPTINLSINNNVQNVIVTPLNNGQPQQIYPQQNVGPQINSGQGISNLQGQISQHPNQQTSHMNQQFNQANQNMNVHSQPNSNQMNQGLQQSVISHQEQLILLAKQKRTSSEDNVNIQQQIKQGGIQRTNPNQVPGQRVQTNQPSSQTGQWNQQIINYSQKGVQPQSGQLINNQRYLQNNQVYPQKIASNGQQESPIIIKHRKNLPSLNNQPSSEQNSQANFSNSSHHKSGFNQSNVKFKAGAVSQNGSAGGSTTRGVSTDPAIPTAIQKKFVSNFTNGSGFLPGTRENSQNSGQNQKETHIHLNQTQTPGSLASSAGAPTGAVNLVYSNGKQRLDSQGQSIEGGSQGGINFNQVNTNSSQRADSKHSQNKETNNTISGPPKIDDTILVERDQLIKYIKQYIKRNNELPPTTLNFYRFVKLIGKGAFGKVTLGVHKLTGKQVAIKTIEKNYMQDDFSKRKVFQEVYLLKKIKHSNVIRLLEVFESSKHLLMVMEYAGGGDLLRLIKRKGKLQESDAKFIFKQIAYGLAHIHCRSVIHRDIKLDNILLDCEKGVKICDFGVSKIIKKGQVIQEQCGTPAYLAPEIIIDKGYEGFFVDIWSLGVLLFAMLCGTVPFKASNLEDLHKLILKGDFIFPVELSSEAQALVRGMIILEPKNRLTFPQILSHTWLKETNDDESEEEEENQEEENGEKKVDNQAVSGGMPQGQNKPDIDLKNIQGNVNYVNVDNLFYVENYKIKLSYTDYCCITEDFSTENIDEEALQVCENFGFPRQFLIKCLNRGDINHATACYYLLTNAG